MALDFPTSPSIGQKYPAAPVAGVPTYTWDGEKWRTTVLYDTSFPLRSYLAGFGLTWNSTTSITVNAGTATDSTNTVSIANNSAVIKGTGAWAAGNAGAIDTGAFALNKTYHWFVIRNPTTGIVDALFSLSPTAPTLPSGYTQFRRIMSLNTDVGAATWMMFMQDGDVVTLNAPITQSLVNPGTAAFPITLGGVPTGIRVEAKVFIGVLAAAAADQAISWYATEVGWPTDQVPNVGSYATTAAYAASFAGSFSIGAMNLINTNTSAQIRCRLQVSAAGTSFYSRAFGWRDRRGKDG